jgi:epoxyqueuosine reductase
LAKPLNRGDEKTVTLTEEFKQHAKEAGIDLLGYTSASPFLVGEEKREVNPRDFLPGARSIVVAALYLYGCERSEPTLPGAPRGRYGPGTRTASVSARYLEKVLKGFLEKRGFQAVVSGKIPHKMAAVRSGIAYYGKNCIAYADPFGSSLRLSAVITDAELDPVDRPIEVSDCGDCNLCLEACPTNALDRPYHLIREQCICIWLGGDPIPRQGRERIGTYLRRCGFCQDVCPKNQGLALRQEFPFEIEPMSDSPELIPLLLGDEEYYKSALPEYVLRARIDTIRRNVAVALGNSGDEAAIPALIQALKFKHAETRQAAAWALGKLNAKAAQKALKKALREEKEEEARKDIEEALRIIS